MGEKMKFKKFFAALATGLLLVTFTGCQPKKTNQPSPKTLRLAEAINSSTQRIWYICYTPKDQKLTKSAEVGGVLVSQDAKITGYVIANSHKTLTDFKNKKNNEAVISYAKQLAKQNSKDATTAKSNQAIIKKQNQVNLYMDMTGTKVAGEGISGFTAPGYFMTRLVSKTKIDQYYYAGLQDPAINNANGQSAYYTVTRLDNSQQKFAFDRLQEKNTKKVYMKSYPKKKAPKNSDSRDNGSNKKSSTKSSK